MARNGCRPADRTRNHTDAARRSKVSTEQETKDQRSLRRPSVRLYVVTSPQLPWQPRVPAFNSAARKQRDITR